ncbi:MAG: GNAT family N-acetyltransferase [Mucilaginibacter sp.]
MFTIRKATPNDAAILQQVAKPIWWHTYLPLLTEDHVAYMFNERYSIKELTEQIEQSIQTYLLLFEDSELVAFASYGPREDDPQVYKLHKLYCLPSTQGKGYGKALINEVFKNVAALGIKTLELNVNRYNKSCGFYEKMGFTVAYEEDIPIGPYWMNDYVMRKEL